MFLGIDTSNYTTSIALFSENDGIISNDKVPLRVEEGKRGLRQSDAVFSHIKNAPPAAESLGKSLSMRKGEIVSVGYSAKPRPLEGSYMPCFLVGEAIALFISASLSAPAFPFSHQEGHIAAAAYSACRSNGLDLREFLKRPFLSFHVSGGTFDLLSVEPDPDRIITVRRVGGSKDASAGQIIDRTGVRLGIGFPCGAEMDRLALEYNGTVKHDGVCVDGLYCNISGLENKAIELIGHSADQTEVAAYVLDHISRTVRKMTYNAVKEFGNIPVLYAGGVMSSKYIKSRLADVGLFSEPEFSSDNAAGVAVLSSLLYSQKQN